MRLNVCCGKRHREGWVNIDIAAWPGATPPDIVCDARAIPLPNSCADELACIHGLEHFHRFEVDALIEEWKRLLKPGGLLVLELPDLIKCCRNIIEGYTGPKDHPEQMGLWGLYGEVTPDNLGMAHKYGWSPQTLRAFLTEHGFVKIIEAPTQWHPSGKLRRDMRIEARKP